MRHHNALEKLHIADVCNAQPCQNDVCRHPDIGEVAQQALWKGPCIPGVQGHHKPAHPRPQTEEDKLRGWERFQLLQSSCCSACQIAICRAQSDGCKTWCLLGNNNCRRGSYNYKYCSDQTAFKGRVHNVVLCSTAGCCISRCVQCVVIYVSHVVLTSHFCILLYIKFLLQSGQRCFVNISPKLLLRPQGISSSDRLLLICHKQSGKIFL